MITEFQRLTESETELMLKAPILVCILIAGADGDIDRKEIREAISIARGRDKVKSVLSTYFEIMAEDFEDKIKILIQSYPYESSQRNPLIIQELAQLNGVWKKLTKEFSMPYYEMLKNVAIKIASSSGGLWGMKKIGAEEEKYLKLPMIADPSGLS